LVASLAFEGVKTPKAANKFLIDKGIDQYNDRFSVASKFEPNVHRPIDGYNLR
jgi:hypothetical protein